MKKYDSTREIYNPCAGIYIFDFNFPSSYKIIKENKYLEKFYDRIKDTFKSEDIINKTKELLEICNKYMDKELLKI